MCLCATSAQVHIRSTATSAIRFSPVCRRACNTSIMTVRSGRRYAIGFGTISRGAGESGVTLMRVHLCGQMSTARHARSHNINNSTDAWMYTLHIRFAVYCVGKIFASAKLSRVSVPIALRRCHQVYRLALKLLQMRGVLARARVCVRV